MTELKKPVLSPRFDVEDIRKLREYNALRHAQMTDEEIFEEYRQSMEWFRKEMLRIRAKKARQQRPQVTQPQ